MQAPFGQPDDHVRRQSPPVARDRFLLRVVAVRDHSGAFDDVPELDFAPASALVRRTECPDELVRLDLQRLMRVGERRSCSSSFAFDPARSFSTSWSLPSTRASDSFSGCTRSAMALCARRDRRALSAEIHRAWFARGPGRRGCSVRARPARAPRTIPAGSFPFLAAASTLRRQFGAETGSILLSEGQFLLNAPQRGFPCGELGGTLAQGSIERTSRPRLRPGARPRVRRRKRRSTRCPRWTKFRRKVAEPQGYLAWAELELASGFLPATNIGLFWS